eukprot:m.239225 g.239225  ORF g.239225 m.239225 type:complete len:847 (-) comp13451_c0_seq1:124-2664(-)
MSHTAFDIVSVLDWKSLPFQIESIDTSETQLFVGTSKGQLLVYNVVLQDNKYNMDLVETKKAFSKKPVTQLHVVRELNLLISLSDNVIQVHDLTTFTLRRTIEKSRGCVSFSADLQIVGQPKADTHRLSALRKQPGTNLTLRLAAVLKRKIITFTWTNSDFVDQKEMALPETPRVVIWCGKQLVLGYSSRREYDLIDEDSLSVTKIFTTGEKQAEAVGARIPGNQLLLNNNNTSYFKELDGTAAREYSISWSDGPLAIDVVEPFVIGFLPKTIEIRTLDKGTLVQTTPYAARFMALDTLAFASSDNTCWILRQLPMDHQIDELMQRQQFEEALALSTRLDKDDPRRDEKLLKINKAFALSELQKKNYTRAMSTYAKLNVSPMEVISLVPFLVRDSAAAPARPAPDPADQEAAVSALIEYLTQRRLSVAKRGDEATKFQYLETIDTTLLRCYLQYNQAMVGPLLRLQPNYCNVEESEKLLKSADKLPELVLLYRNRGMHRNALELLQLNASGRTPALQGPWPTIEYLQKLGPEFMDLILDFSRWVLQAEPKESLIIFTDDNAQFAHQLPRDRVVTHLKAVAPVLVVPYLEHIIRTWGENGAEFHNQLLLAYLDRVLKAGFSEQGPERRQLLNFLNASQYYKPETMMTHFIAIDGLFEERAVLLGRLGRHEKALELYAIRLQDAAKAEEYCTQHYAADPSVYLSLLKIYLPAESGAPMNTHAALDVLRKHHERIDTTEALKLLPTSTKVCDVQEFLVAVLRERAVARRDAQVLRNLAKTESVQVHVDLLQAHSIRVDISEEQLCFVCRKPIRTSAFLYYPNRIMAHIFCSSDPSICPCTNPNCTLQHK